MRTTSTLVGLVLFTLTATARAEEAAPAAAATAPPAGETAAAPASAPTPTPTPTPAPAATPSAPLADNTAAALTPAAMPPAVSRRKIQVGLSFLPMALGKYVYSPNTVSTVTSDASFAYGLGLSAGYEVLPHLLVGLAPQVILNVKEKTPMIPAKAVNEYDLMARVAYVLPVVETIDVYAEVLPGYSIIKNDAAPAGLVLAFGVGGAMEITDRAFVNLGAGYQMGFQQWKEGENTYDTKTRYIRVVLGGGMKF